MRKLILITLVAMFSNIATFSDTLTDGFYRVSCKGSGYSLYVRDCTGYASDTKVDMDAIELWKNNEISDPGSIMYIIEKNETYDITAQNTGIQAITGITIKLYNNNNSWQVWYSGKYLYDIGDNKSSKGTGYSEDTKRHYLSPGTSGDGIQEKYKLWDITAVGSSTDNYFGFQPTVTTTGTESYYTNNKSFVPFYAAFAYTPVNSKLKTWYVSKVDKTNGIAVIKEVTEGTVAKSQPVIIECVGATAAENKVNLTIDDGTEASDNKLSGTYFCNGQRNYIDYTVKKGDGTQGSQRTDKAVVEFDNATMRVLGTDDNGHLAFVSEDRNLTQKNITTTDVYSNASTYKTTKCIPHNHSYLVVGKDCPATLLVMTEEEYNKKYPTAIHEATAEHPGNASNIYTVSGAKVNQMQSGQLYIVDGKKVINK